MFSYCSIAAFRLVERGRVVFDGVFEVAQVALGRGCSSALMKVGGRGKGAFTTVPSLVHRGWQQVRQPQTPLRERQVPLFAHDLRRCLG
jgi:hypothetical protein